MISYWQFCASYVGARYGRSEHNASAVEHAMVIALIVIACVAALAFLSHGASLDFGRVNLSINST